MLKRKRLLSLALAAAVAFSAAFAANYQRAAAADAGVTVFVNGAQVNFGDVQPDIINGRTMVPLRSIGDILNAHVSWIGEMEKVVIIIGSKYADLAVGSPYMTIVDTAAKTVKAEKLDASPVNISGRVLVPVRAISMAFGADVGWDGATKRVDIRTSGYTPQTTAPATPPPTQAPAAGPSLSPVFGSTQSFKIDGGNRIQALYNNIKTTPFVLLYFDSSDDKAIAAMPAITYSAANVGTQVFGLDVKSSGRINEIGGWLWKHVDKDSASPPVLLFCYADGTIITLNDLASPDAIGGAFKNWRANIVITATATPAPSETQTPAPTATPFDLGGIANYSPLVHRVTAKEAQNLFESGQMFFLVCFDSSKGPAVFTDIMSRIFQAANMTSQRIEVMDTAQANMDDAKFIKNWYGSSVLPENPAMLFVSGGSVQQNIQNLQSMSAEDIAESMRLLVSGGIW